MAVAWKGRPAGVAGLHDGHSGIDWDIWQGLRDRKAGALVEEYQTKGSYSYVTGRLTRGLHWLRLSALGEEFYLVNWQRYREMYPDVDAPAPGGGTVGP